MNKERFLKDFRCLAEFGKLENGGVTRLAFSDEDIAARNYLIKAMEDANLLVSIDGFGNIRGTRPGKGSGQRSEEGPKEGPEEIYSAPVILGSHLDTVPCGGHFDGVIGVLGALEVVRTMNDRNIVTKHPVEVVNFSCEESSRFRVSTVGSKVMTGQLSLEHLKKAKDKDGISLYQALERSGYEPDKLAQARILEKNIHAFIEMHIEQGPVLEKENCQVGIVTAIAAPTRFRVTIIGRADHSGNTPMNLRKDALTGACELILGVEKIATLQAGKNTVGTVGYADIKPGSMNVVPGQVELGIDLRDISKEDKDDAMEKIIVLMDEIKEKRNLEIEYEILSNEVPVTLSDKIIDTLEQEAKNNKLNYKKMTSGAGHDAMNMAKIADTGMIFIPSINGISHNIAEASHFSDIFIGCELLFRTTLMLAQEDFVSWE